MLLFYKFFCKGFIKYNIRVIGHAEGYFILTLKKVNVVVVYANVFNIFCYCQIFSPLSADVPAAVFVMMVVMVTGMVF